MSTFTATTEEELSAGQLYPVTLEFRENYGAAEAHLSWQSDSQPIEVRMKSSRSEVEVKYMPIYHERVLLLLVHSEAR